MDGAECFQYHGDYLCRPKFWCESDGSDAQECPLRFINGKHHIDYDQYFLRFLWSVRTSTLCQRYNHLGFWYANHDDDGALLGLQLHKDLPFCQGVARRAADRPADRLFPFVPLFYSIPEQITREKV